MADYTGDILLVAINYDKGTKKHECEIERCRKEKRIKMGKAARRKAELEFALEGVVKKHLEIYHRVYE